MATKTKTVQNATANYDFLMQGASWIKKNRDAFQTGCASLAGMVGINEDARTQLLAAAKAAKVEGDKAPNTGLRESGWAGLALTIGACSPKSTKTLPSDKPGKMSKWLFKDATTPELKGKGSTRNLLTAEQLLEAGITRQFLGKERKEAADLAARDLVTLLETNQARLIAKREEQKAKRDAAKGNTPPVTDTNNEDTGLV